MMQDAMMVKQYRQAVPTSSADELLRRALHLALRRYFPNVL